MGEVKIKSGNLANGELEQGGVSISGGKVSSAARVRGYANVKPLTAYTITANKAFRICYGYNYDGLNLERVGLIFDNNSGNNKLTTFTTPEGCNYIRFALWNGDESNIIPTDIQNLNLVEGTYTSETIPEYQPYFLNHPAHQFTNGQWVDIPTHHYTNGRWQGELTSQSPLKFWADGEMLDWRVEGKTSGNLWDGTFINTSGWGISFSLDDNWYMVGSSNNDPREWGYSASQIKMTLGTGTYALVLQGVPPTKSWSGAMIYTSGGSALANNPNLVNKPLIIMPFTLAQETSIGIMVKVVNGKYRVQLLEGTYTTSTIPPYEPYGGVGDWDETAQRYKIPVRVESKNLFDINGEHISNSRLGITCFVVDDNKLVVQIISPGGTTRITYPNNFYNPNVYTVSVKLTGELTGIRFLSTSPFPGGTYNTTYRAYWKAMTLNGGIYTTTFSPTETTTIGFVVMGADDARNPGTVENISLYEGTYTASTIPPYEVNLFTDHQLLDGDSIDYATDQTAIPIATGNNILTVDTAVKPSKVYVKFEG